MKDALLFLLRHIPFNTSHLYNSMLIEEHLNKKKFILILNGKINAHVQKHSKLIYWDAFFIHKPFLSNSPTCISLYIYLGAILMTGNTHPLVGRRGW